MDDEMMPKLDDDDILIPAAFDHKGGVKVDVKGKLLTGLWTFIGVVFGIVLLVTSNDLSLAMKILGVIAVLYGGLWVTRFIIMDEMTYSINLETQKLLDYVVPTTSIWQVFSVDYDYPYTVYFRNGYKGVFIRMEKDVTTGKSADDRYYHYQAISNAYNIAHSNNMNIIHIDYMDSVGNDKRLVDVKRSLVNVENPYMQDVMSSIYDHLQYEMNMSYASFDVYLFLSKDKQDNLFRNINTVASAMLGANFITYKTLNRNDIATICKALFGMKNFSVVDACEALLASSSHSGIIAISHTGSDGVKEILNKTQEEIRFEREDMLERQEELKRRKKQRKRSKTNKNNESDQDTDLDLF